MLQKTPAQPAPKVVAKKITSPLARKATLIMITVSAWTARKNDKEAAKELHDKHKAAADSGRYVARLLSKTSLEDLRGIKSRIFRLKYRYTKPWGDESLRILPNSLHLEFVKQLRELIREYDAAADALVSKYDSLVQQRRRERGTLFNPKHYPSKQDLKGKYSVTYQTMPVPDADDFRSDVLDADTVADIKREISENGNVFVDEAMKHSYQKIAKVVGIMADRLKHYGKEEGDRFYDAWIENVQELAKLLPNFNLTDDPEYTKLVARINKELCSTNTETIKEDDVVRKKIVKSADEILKTVGAMLS